MQGAGPAGSPQLRVLGVSADPGHFIPYRFDFTAPFATSVAYQRFTSCRLSFELTHRSRSIWIPLDDDLVGAEQPVWERVIHG
jgi:hypothetical protein